MEKTDVILVLCVFFLTFWGSESWSSLMHVAEVLPELSKLHPVRPLRPFNELVFVATIAARKQERGMAPAHGSFLGGRRLEEVAWKKLWNWGTENWQLDSGSALWKPRELLMEFCTLADYRRFWTKGFWVWLGTNLGEICQQFPNKSPPKSRDINCHHLPRPHNHNQFMGAQLGAFHAWCVMIKHHLNSLDYGSLDLFDMIWIY